MLHEIVPGGGKKAPDCRQHNLQGAKECQIHNRLQWYQDIPKEEEGGWQGRTLRQGLYHRQSRRA